MHWILYLALLTGPYAGQGGAYKSDTKHVDTYQNKAACMVVKKQQLKELEEGVLTGMKEGKDFTLTCKQEKDVK